MLRFTRLLIISLSAVHARRIAALKALSYAPTDSTDVLDKLYEIVFGILNKVSHPARF